MYQNDQEGRSYINNGDIPVQTNGKKKQTGNLGKKIGVMVLSGLVFGAVAAGAFTGVRALLGIGAAAVGASEQKETNVVATVSYTANDTELSQTLDVSDIAEGMMPSMVSITNTSVQEVQSYFGLFGRQQTQTQESQSSGTGIIIGENDSELLIVTNNHVVEDATMLSVEVIKVAKIGDSDALKVGQQVVAIGNALGYGQSVTTGIVSAVGRQIDTTDAIMIQTDAAINPGNSGGALLNMDGEVIGINSAKFSSTEVEGMGYAISITQAMPIIEDLMNRTTREKVPDEDASYLGIYGEDITASIASAYDIPQGIYITSIEDDSPLAEAGVKVKSVITHFDGIRVTSYSNLKNRMQYYAAGETVEVTVQMIEGGEYVEKTVEITLGRKVDHETDNEQGGFGFGTFGRP